MSGHAANTISEEAKGIGRAVVGAHQRLRISIDLMVHIKEFEKFAMKDLTANNVWMPKLVGGCNQDLRLTYLPEGIAVASAGFCSCLLRTVNGSGHLPEMRTRSRSWTSVSSPTSCRHRIVRLS